MPESEPLGLPILTPTPDPDVGWSIHVLDRNDPEGDSVDVIRQFSSFAFNTPQDEFGVGTIDWDLDDPVVGSVLDAVANPCYLSFRQGDSERQRILFEGQNTVKADPDTNARKLVLLGRVAAAYVLECCVVLPDGYPANKKAISRAFVDRTWASVWIKLFKESRDRLETHTPDGLTQLVKLTFTAEADSFGEAWATTSDFDIPCGGDLAGLLRDHADQFGFGWTVTADGHLIVSQSGYVGSDRTEEVRFFFGKNVQGAEDVLDRSAVRTRVYVEDSAGDITGVQSTAAYTDKHGLRAAYVSASDITGAATREKVANQRLKILQRQAASRTWKVPARPKHPFTGVDLPMRPLFNYYVGDLIGEGAKLSDGSHDYRVIDLAYAVDGNGQEEVELVIEGRIQQFLRKLDRAINQSGSGPPGSNGGGGGGGGGGGFGSTIRFYDDNWDVTNPRTEFALTYLPLANSEHVTVSIEDGAATRKLRRGQEWSRVGRRVTVPTGTQAFPAGDGPWWFEVQYAYNGTDPEDVVDDDPIDGDDDDDDGDDGDTGTMTTQLATEFEKKSIQVRCTLNGGSIADPDYVDFDATSLAFVARAVTHTDHASYNNTAGGPPAGIDPGVWTILPGQLGSAGSTLIGFTHDAFVAVLGLSSREYGDARFALDNLSITGNSLMPDEIPGTIVTDTWEARMVGSGVFPTGGLTWLFDPHQLTAVTLGDATGLGGSFAVAYDPASEFEVVFNQGDMSVQPNFIGGSVVALGGVPEDGDVGEWHDISGLVANSFLTWNGFFFNLKALTMPTFNIGLGGNADYSYPARWPTIQVRRTILWDTSGAGSPGEDGADLTLYQVSTDYLSQFASNAEMSDADDDTYFTAVGNGSIFDAYANPSDYSGQPLMVGLWTGIGTGSGGEPRTINHTVTVKFRFPGGGDNTLFIPGRDFINDTELGWDGSNVTDDDWHIATFHVTSIVGDFDGLYVVLFAEEVFSIAEISLDSWGFEGEGGGGGGGGETLTPTLDDVRTNGGATGYTPGIFDDESDATFLTAVGSASDSNPWNAPTFAADSEPVITWRYDVDDSTIGASSVFVDVNARIRIPDAGPDDDVGIIQVAGLALGGADAETIDFGIQYTDEATFIDVAITQVQVIGDGGQYAFTLRVSRNGDNAPMDFDVSELAATFYTLGSGGGGGYG